MSGRSRELPDDQLDLGLTHAAIYVRDIEASVRFYERYAGLRAIHRRGSGAARVAWVSDLKRPFGLVLIQRRVGPLRRWLSRTLSPLRLALAHIGVALDSSEEVDFFAARARHEGILAREPRDAGHPVGYYCMISDPDGNMLELSHGQVVSRAIVEATAHEE